MGDRGNIVIRQVSNKNTDDVWLYTHWSGSEIKDTVREALARKERWDDPSYLARIVFCKLVEGAEKDATGFGISCRMQDNGHSIIVMDTEENAVYEVPESAIEDGRLPDKLKFKPVSFKKFCATAVK